MRGPKNDGAAIPPDWVPDFTLYTGELSHLNPNYEKEIGDASAAADATAEPLTPTREAVPPVPTGVVPTSSYSQKRRLFKQQDTNSVYV